MCSQVNITELVKSLPDNTGIEASVLGDTVRLLANLYWIKEDGESSVSTLAGDVIEALKTSVDTRGKLSDLEFDSLKKRLTLLLSIDGCLAVTAKAGYIASRGERAFSSSRIFTDARPIYSSEPGKSPDAFVITHMLQINVAEEGKDKPWFAILDSDDLCALNAQLIEPLKRNRAYERRWSKRTYPY